MTEFRTANLAELEVILSWAAAEGWNPGLDDATAFYSADPEGFFVAIDAGQPIAAISVVNHTDSFAFLGLYIVLPDYRGRGIGYGLWQHALAHAGTRTVGLDGVPDQQANYAASGFTHAGATTRYAGQVTATTHPTLRLAETGDMETLIDMEATASGVRKPAYLTPWFTETATRKTIVAPDRDAISGLCTVRQCREGAKIGPLITPSTEVATQLIEQAAILFPGDVIIDVPGASRSLATLCQNYGLSPGFETARMYRGPFEIPEGGVFAVASLELG